MRSRSFSDEPGPQLRERRVSIEKMTVSGARYWLPKEESVRDIPSGRMPEPCSAPEAGWMR